MIKRKDKKNGNFTQVDNEYLRRNDLSLRAKGLLTLMLSFPEDWHFRFVELKELSTNGTQSTRTAINELRDEGYIHYYKKPKKGGGFSHIYDVYEDFNDNSYK